MKTTNQIQNQTQPVETQITPIKRQSKTKGNSFDNKFQKPVKQSIQPLSNTELILKATVTNSMFDQPSIVTKNTRSDYKFYLTPNGSYNLVFDAYGSSVSVTSFGRVKDFTMPSNGTNAKPTYSYRGLLDGVGSLPLQYNYEGRVAAVGGTELSYNYNGAIDKVGSTPIYYNPNGTVDKIGNSKITYDYLGNIVNMDKNPMILVKQ